MAVYYILDGNNIIKSTQVFLDAAGGNFIKAQYELVEAAHKALVRRSSGDALDVVFDGAGMNYRFIPPLGAKVKFSKDRSADRVICEKIKKASDLWVQGHGFDRTVVVSDDLEIRECAKLFGAESWRTAEFVEKIFPRKAEKPRSQAKQVVEKTIRPDHQVKITEELEKHFGIKK